MQTLLALLALSLPLPSHAEAFTMRDALERFRTDFRDSCTFGKLGELNYDLRRRRTAVTYTLTKGSERYRVFKILCRGEAPKGKWAFYVSSPEEPPRLMQFAEPRLDGNAELQGYSQETLRENPVFDLKKRELRFEAWDAGMGRYHRTGVYRFDRGEFTLKSYEVAWLEGGSVHFKKVVDER